MRLEESRCPAGNFQTSAWSSPVWNSSGSHLCPEPGVVSPEVPCRRVLCHIPGEGAWPDPFQLCPGEEPGRPMEKEPWLQDEAALPPGFWYSQKPAVFFLKMNFLPGRSWEHLPVLPCLDLSRAGSLQPGLSWPCGWMWWVFLGIAGPLECRAAPWPLTPPLLRVCGCFLPTKSRLFHFLQAKCFSCCVKLPLAALEVAWHVR